MPKFTLPLKAVPGHARGAFQLWNLVRGLNIADLARLAEAPFHLALIGTEDHTRLLAARLALESPEPQDLGASGPPDLGAFVQSYRALPDVPSGSLTLDADALTGSETELAATLAGMAAAHPDLRISLARHVPAFRPAVSALLINESAKENAKMAMLSALPGVLPFTDLLLPATSLGDMILLTKNQGLLLLAIAAAYGKEVDLKARTRELLPVVGSAFGWRTAARQLLGLVPGGVGGRGQRRGRLRGDLHRRQIGVAVLFDGADAFRAALAADVPRGARAGRRPRPAAHRLGHKALSAQIARSAVDFGSRIRVY